MFHKNIAMYKILQIMPQNNYQDYDVRKYFTANVASEIMLENVTQKR